MSESTDGSRGVDGLRADMAHDERDGRPGPKPPRVSSDLEWRDLARLIVTTEVEDEPGAERS